jgi:hypothetical protein
MRIVAYDTANDGNTRFRMASFYFYGRRETHKIVLRFDKGTVTLSQRQGQQAPWVDLKTWSIA